MAHVSCQLGLYLRFRDPGEVLQPALLLILMLIRQPATFASWVGLRRAVGTYRIVQHRRLLQATYPVTERSCSPTACEPEIAHSKSGTPEIMELNSGSRYLDRVEAPRR